MILSEEQVAAVYQEVEATIGDFLAREITPYAAERDESATPFSRELLARAGALGLLAGTVPAEVGGMGKDIQTYGLILEHIGYLCDDLSFPLVTSLHGSVCETIYRSGRPDLIERYVRPMARGQRLGSFAYTDQADAFAFASVVRQVGSEYVLDGYKSHVTGGASADTFMTYVRDEHDDLKVFLIERDDPGVEIEPLPLMGFRSAGLVSLTFHDTVLGPERMLVAADGLSHAQMFLNRRRVILVCGTVGRMRGLLQACIRYLEQTTRYKRPLTTMQNVQAKLGQMYVALETARTLTHASLGRQARGAAHDYWDPMLTLTKYQVVKQAVMLAQTAMGLVGGRSYVKSSPFERNLRDFIGLIPAGGAQDILETDLGGHAIFALQRDVR